MTDLDVYFWRLFALGVGFAATWLSWSWLVLMGRATRVWLSAPTKAREIFDSLYRRDQNGRWSIPWSADTPDWYRAYIAFREVGYWAAPNKKPRLIHISRPLGQRTLSDFLRLPQPRRRL